MGLDPRRELDAAVQKAFGGSVSRDCRSAIGTLARADALGMEAGGRLYTADHARSQAADRCRTGGAIDAENRPLSLLGRTTRAKRSLAGTQPGSLPRHAAHRGAVIVPLRRFR